MPKGCHNLTHEVRCQVCALWKAAARTERSQRSAAGTGRRSATRSGATAADADTHKQPNVKVSARRGLVGCREDDAGSGGARWRTGWRRAGARTGPPAASARRASRWRAGSGYANTSAPTGRPGGGSTCSCAGGAGSRTGRAVATRAGAASRTARTSPSARRSWRRRSGSAAGRRTRSSASRPNARGALRCAGGPGVGKEFAGHARGFSRRRATRGRVGR